MFRLFEAPNWTETSSATISPSTYTVKYPVFSIKALELAVMLIPSSLLE